MIVLWKASMGDAYEKPSWAHFAGLLCQSRSVCPSFYRVSRGEEGGGWGGSSTRINPIKNMNNVQWDKGEKEETAIQPH